MFRTRFAPSPTGPLHLGHAYSAIHAHDMAMAAGGQFLVRIEDIDTSRAREHWEAQIYDDLSWLGLRWPEPVMRQSDRTAAYAEALDQLWDMGVLYACTCSRRDILEAASAPQEGVPVNGPDGLIYPGTCRPARTAAQRDRPVAATLRLDVQASLMPDDVFSFIETGSGPEGETGAIRFSGRQVISDIGDVVLARQSMAAAYHLAVVLDDAAQGISHVVRGQDLFEATKIHVVLQRLLGLPTPVYHHHRLIRDESGKRLAKRDDARAISAFRKDGVSMQELREKLAL